jgi:hypothetical protein
MAEVMIPIPEGLPVTEYAAASARRELLWCGLDDAASEVADPLRELLSQKGPHDLKAADLQTAVRAVRVRLEAIERMASEIADTQED